jgi:hypothetical protein
MESSTVPKKRFKLAVWSPAIVVFIFALIFVIAIYVFSPSRYIGATQVSMQEVGGATTTNYMPVLAEDVDWDALSDIERANIARHAVKSTIARATNEGIKNFRVVGLSHSENRPVFLFTGGDNLFIYLGGKATSIPLNG